eukprot:3855310-Lingulodinium_polyedra.AAC.1
MSTHVILQRHTARYVITCAVMNDHTPCDNIQRQTETDCVRLRQTASDCIRLHHTASYCIRLHQAA